MRKRLFRRNQLSLPTPHSVDRQPLPSHSPSTHNDLPHTQSISEITSHRGATPGPNLATVMRTMSKLHAQSLSD